MKCRICDNTKNNEFYDVKDMMFGIGDSFQYFQCSNCECLQISEIPPDMTKYYPTNYYSYCPASHLEQTTTLGLLKTKLMRVRNRYAVHGNNFIGKLLNSLFPNTTLMSLSEISVTKSSRILDVGCGSGYLLSLLGEIGFDSLNGVDPFIEKDIQHGNGIKILKKEIFDIEGKFDLVMFHHSFEHVSDQIRTLITAAQLLVPSGHCIIRIPTVSSYAWEHYRVNWVQLDAPRHFYLHSIQSMKILATQAGLDLYKIIYDSSSFQFWGSEQYVRGIPLRDKRSYSEDPKSSIFSKQKIAEYRKKSSELNRAGCGDQAVFYFRKL